MNWELSQSKSDGESNRDTARDEVAAADLIAAARDLQNVVITERQLERWHKDEDLLPHPRQAHVSGIRGSRSLYPADALPQLLALCRLMHETPGKRPDFDGLRVALWMQGYVIPIERVRASLKALMIPSLHVL